MFIKWADAKKSFFLQWPPPLFSLNQHTPFYNVILPLLVTFFALGHVPPAQNKNVALSLATFQQQFPPFFRMQHHVCSELSQVQYHLLIMEAIFWNLIPISFNKCALLGCLEFFHFINYLKNVTNLRWHLRKVQKENTSLKIEWENKKRNNFSY